MSANPPPTEADIERQLLEDVLNRITRLNEVSLGVVAREAAKLGFGKLSTARDDLAERTAEFLGLGARGKR